MANIKVANNQVDLKKESIFNGYSLKICDYVMNELDDMYRKVY